MLEILKLLIEHKNLSNIFFRWNLLCVVLFFLMIIIKIVAFDEFQGVWTFFDMSANLWLYILIKLCLKLGMFLVGITLIVMMIDIFFTGVNNLFISPIIDILYSFFYVCAGIIFPIGYLGWSVLGYRMNEEFFNLYYWGLDLSIDLLMVLTWIGLLFICHGPVIFIPNVRVNDIAKFQLKRDLLK